MVNVKVTTKRCVSAVMAFLMVAMLVLGVSASPLTQVFAASATKKLISDKHQGHFNMLYNQL